jgi:hypothetical protein
MPDMIKLTTAMVMEVISRLSPGSKLAEDYRSQAENVQISFFMRAKAINAKKSTSVYPSPFRPLGDQYLQTPEFERVFEALSEYINVYLDLRTKAVNVTRHHSGRI